MRSWQRLQILGAPAESSSEPEGRDALYHFCQDALHLRDWIINDPAITNPNRTQRTQDLRTLFSSTSPALAACADIANGSKHLEQRKYSYTSGESGAGHARLTGQGVTIGVPAMTLEGESGGSVQYHWFIGGDWEALDLAANVVADWDTWLNSCGLL